MTRSDIAIKSASARSRVANGKSLFVDETIDGRSKYARRFRDVLTEIVNDMGGLNLMSEGQKQLARRLALLSVQCEKMEGEAVAGKDIDLDSFGRLSDRLGRGFQRLGLKRVSKEVRDSLVDHFERPFEGDGE